MLCDECQGNKCDRCGKEIELIAPLPEIHEIPKIIRKGVGWEYGIALFMFGMLFGMGLLILGKLI